jgi:hypothetical protein
VEKREGKRQLGRRTRHRREGNIKMDEREIGCENVNWIQLDQDRVLWQALVNALMNL